MSTRRRDNTSKAVGGQADSLASVSRPYDHLTVEDLCSLYSSLNSSEGVTAESIAVLTDLIASPGWSPTRIVRVIQNYKPVGSGLLDFPSCAAFFRSAYRRFAAGTCDCHICSAVDRKAKMHTEENLRRASDLLRGVDRDIYFKKQGDEADLESVLLVATYLRDGWSELQLLRHVQRVLHDGRIPFFLLGRVSIAEMFSVDVFGGFCPAFDFLEPESALIDDTVSKPTWLSEPLRLRDGQELL